MFPTYPLKLSLLSLRVFLAKVLLTINLGVELVATLFLILGLLMAVPTSRLFFMKGEPLPVIQTRDFRRYELLNRSDLSYWLSLQLFPRLIGKGKRFALRIVGLRSFVLKPYYVLLNGALVGEFEDIED